MLPYAIVSDHSLERGGNQPKEYIDAAKAQSVSRLCLFDYDVMSGVVSFLRDAKKHAISPIVGIYLPISIPELDTYNVRYGIDRLSNELPEYSQCFVRLSKEQLESLILASIAYLKSKAKSKTEKFISTLAESGVKIPVNAVFAVANCAVKLTDIVHDPFDCSRLGLIAINTKGYKALLRLASKVALKEQKIKQGLTDDLPVAKALTFDEIKEEASHLALVDPLLEDSILGKIDHKGQVLSDEHANILKQNNVLVGVTQIVKMDSLARFQVFNKVPFPIAMFAESFHFEEFCVKHAALTKMSMSKLQYQAPVDKHAHIWEPDRLEKFYGAVCAKYDLHMKFWETIEETNVTLDNYVLPSYKINEYEVAEYFCREKGIAFLNPVMSFDKFIQDNKPDDKPFMVYRKEQYESYCMHKMAWEGVIRKCDERYQTEVGRKELQERFDMEFNVIEGMGFSGYFLIMQDIIGYARKIGVPVGEARGSAAGSLIVYGLDITDVDPLEYGLQFERFLNPERISMPDIDVDFGSNGEVGRENVIAYIREQYSSDAHPFASVSQIANINRFGLKNSFDFACEAIGLPAYYKRYIKTLIAEVELDLSVREPVGVSFEELESHDGFAKRMKSEPMLNKVTQRAKGLYNKKQTNGVHAGGVVIAPTMIPDYSALGCSAKGALVSQFDKDDIEAAGLVKLDILGLVNLSVMSEANNQIEQRHGVRVDLRSIDRKDKDVFAMINQGLTKGIFQIESAGMQSLVKKLQPESIEELGALSALFRPGALQSGMVEDYVDTKHGLKPLEFDHPAMQEVTSETYGCIVYQEQVMSIARLLGDYTLGEADQLRRAMGKKKVQEMVRHKGIFIGRALKKWREDNIKKGESIFPDIKLDVDLTDISERVPKLKLDEVIHEGVFASPIKTIEFMSRIMNLTQENIELMENRLNDISYTVGLFKKDYQQPIYMAISQRLLGMEDSLIKEVKVRLYYALSQWVRFHWIFNKIEKFAGYGFNKSHAIGYSFISYDTAYFKYHYSVEYYAACMSYASMDELDSFAKEAFQYKKIRLLKPDINKSMALFKAEGCSDIRYGLQKLHGVKNAAASIIESREKVGEFENLWHFIESKLEYDGQNLSTTVLKALSMTGAFDDFIPKAVKISKQINGRKFMSVMSSAMRSHPLSGHDGMNEIMDMENYDIHKVAAIWCMIHHKKGLVAHLKSIPKQSAVQEEVVLPLVYLTNFGKREKVGLEAIERFKQIAKLLHESRPLFDVVIDWMKRETKLSLVDTVSEEKALSGIYLTSTPLNAVDAYRKAEREPPGTYVDGCPVFIPDIDSEYDEEMVSTVGAVKNVEEKTVSNPESTMFNQKILTFVLEDGMYSMNASVLGTKAVNFMKKYIEENAIIMAIGRIRNNERFGLSLNLEVCKRYYPEEDPAFIKVPRIKNGLTSSKVA